MSLKQMKLALARELSTERNMTFFQTNKKRHPVLANHETAMSVLAVLSDESSQRWEERESIVRAIIEESQYRPHSYWSTLIIVSFYPMLSKLRNRIVSDAVSRDDLDQMVMSSFIEVVDDFPLGEKPDRTCMHLRQMTQRRVFHQLGLAQAEQVNVRSVKAEELKCREIELAMIVEMDQLDGGHQLRWPDMKPPAPKSPSEKEQSELIEFLVDKVGDEIDRDRLDLIIATKIRGQRLSDVVRHLHPDLSEGNRGKTYHRLKRRHSRTLVQLRELLADLYCPQTDPSSALPLRSNQCSPRR